MRWYGNVASLALDGLERELDNPAHVSSNLSRRS